MVKLGRHILIIVLSFLLLACASARMAEEVQSGKVTFDSGNFKQAFAQLLPLAVKCSPEAQYAVGYMYYYGLGVEAHKESGVFWIKQSAAQMYRPAIKAMQLIEKNKFKPCEVVSNKSNKINLSEKTESKPQEDPVRMAANATPENKEDPVLASLSDLKPPKPKLVAAAVKEEHPDKFTLQLFGSYKLDDVKQLQNRLTLQDKTQYGLTKHNGRDWYVLAYGKYPAVSNAKIAKDTLPQNAQKLNPWVRRTEEVRWIG